jgi:hypothetical protein
MALLHVIMATNRKKTEFLKTKLDENAAKAELAIF